MGLPEIIISFQRKADTAIRSGSRGMVAVVLDDTTKNQMLTPYRRWRDVVQEDWTKESLKALELVFKGSPQRVVAVRLLKDEETPDLAGTLKEILRSTLIIWRTRHIRQGTRKRCRRIWKR